MCIGGIMKTIEEIREEYKDFEIESSFITNAEELVAFLMVGIDDTYEIERDNNKEIRYNKMAEVEARIRNIFFFLFEEEEVEFYDEDNALLLECNKLVDYYRNLYQRIIDVADNDNYLELVKLVDFATKYYNEHIDYFDYQRDRLESLLKGFSMYNPKYQDNRDVIKRFMDEKLSIYKSSNKELVRSIDGKNRKGI